jgi:2-polyprenyl-3-methyl-5-hydroxy-6-metoxy-1,4-benzoquinol methylase
MAEGKSLAELKKALDSGMINLDDDSWKQFYDEKFKVGEKPFYGLDSKNIHYRFQWILKKCGEKGKSLDIGCSTGLLSKLMIEKGLTAAGMDVSSEAVKHAQEGVPDGTFVEGFADKEIPWEAESFDVVTCLEVFEHVKDLNKLIDEIMRVLTKGGKALITTPEGKNYDCTEHVRYFDFYTLYDLFDKREDVADFKICNIYKIGEQERDRKLFAVEVKKHDK